MTLAGDAPTAAEWNDLQPLWCQKLDGPQNVSNATTGTTLVNVTQLVLTPSVSKTYDIDGVIYYTAGATGDIRLAFTFPTGATLYLGGTSYGATGNLVQFSSWLAAVSGTYNRFEGATAAPIFLSGTLVMGSTSGNFQTQFAQDTANATNTSILNGSKLRLTKVA